MIPMTTHHLGQRPGRARLGAFGRGTQGGTGTTCTRALCVVAGGMAGTTDPADWRTPAYPVFTATSMLTLATSGTAHAKGRNSIKRTARHLGTRST